MIAIAGGTGTLGTRLVPRLVGQGHGVRVLTRDIERARHLAGTGIEVVQSDVRDPASVDHALRGASTVISAVSGFASPGTTPASVDEAGNANLIDAAAQVGAAFILMSVVGASPSHPIGLFRAKHAAEVTLRGAGIPWTIVRATAFMETWAAVMARTLQATGKIVVFGRGDNPVNFVSVTDVAALVVRAASDSAVLGQAINLGGPENLTLNQVAGLVHEFTGRRAGVWHIPRPALRLMNSLAVVKPVLARQARSALVMDTIDMSFDPAPTRLAFPDVPETDMATALKEVLA
jgi:uncharacterized protein YbjT (DUF2867 family)